MLPNWTVLVIIWNLCVISQVSTKGKQGSEILKNDYWILQGSMD